MLVLSFREPRLAETGDHLESESEAAELAEWAAGILRSAGTRAQIRVSGSGRRGVAGAILAAATDFQPALIIMSSRGLTELQGLLLGSVLHNLIQLADWPRAHGPHEEQEALASILQRACRLVGDSAHRHGAWQQVHASTSRCRPR